MGQQELNFSLCIFLVGRRGFCNNLKLWNQRQVERGITNHKFFSMTMDQIDIQGASKLASRLKDVLAYQDQLHKVFGIYTMERQLT